MNTTVNIDEASTRLLMQAHDGAEIILAKPSRPYVHLVLPELAPLKR